MAKVYGATSLIGGGAGALDAIDGAGLADKDIAIVSIALDSTLIYTLDADSAAAESSPAIIAMDANGGNKRWILNGFKLGGKSIVLDLDGDTSITADTDDQIDFAASGADQIVLVDGKLYPTTTNDVDLGDATHRFKNVYLSGTVDGATITSPVINTGVSGTAVKDEDNMASDSATALATQQSIKAYVDAYFTGVGVTVPRQKILSFTAWNMDTSASKSVAHGLTHSKICGVRAVVFSNAGTLGYAVGGWSSEGATVDLFMNFDDTNIILQRFATGYFDSASYNAAYGKIIVDYID